MRTFCAGLLVAAITVSSAYAQSDSALAPGKPAGVKQAELGTIGLPLLTFAGLFAFGALIYSVSHSDSTPTAVSTSTTP